MKRVGMFLVLISAASNIYAQDPQIYLSKVKGELDFDQRIVNGLRTSGFPSVVDLIDPVSGASFCTGTLVGCETVVTAAHCVCRTTGANCQPGGPDLTDPADIIVFAQHNGFFAVSGISVPAGYEFASSSDIAVLQLSAGTNGISPSRLNELAAVPTGTIGGIVGFGLTSDATRDGGVKRYGLLETSACVGVPEANHVCWQFLAPLGPPGEDSSTCFGDSGGPMFVDLGQGLVLGGVTSGGGPTCTPDSFAFDTDVFVYHSWVENQAGSDITNQTCGPSSQAGSPEAPIASAEGVLSPTNQEELWMLNVPEGTEGLAVALNGEDGFGNDFDLYVRYGQAPSDGDFDCGSTFVGNPEFCGFLNPTPGTWYFLASQFAGTGLYQLTVTVFGPSSEIFSDTFESGDTSAWSSAVQ